MTSNEINWELLFIESNFNSRLMGDRIYTPNLIVFSAEQFYVKVAGSDVYVKGVQSPMRGLDDLDNHSAEKDQMRLFNTLIKGAVRISTGEWVAGTKVNRFGGGLYYLKITNKPISSNRIDLMEYIKLIPCELESLPSEEQDIINTYGDLKGRNDYQELEPKTNFETPNWTCSVRMRVSYLKEKLTELKKEEEHQAWLKSLSEEERNSYFEEERRKKEAQKEQVRNAAKKKEEEKNAEQKRIKRNKRIVIASWILWLLCLIFFTFDPFDLMYFEWYEYVLGFLGSAVAIIIPFGLTMILDWD